MFQQRSWILQRSNIELLRECQRLVQAHFSERLSLTQNDLIEKIFLFSSKTSNPDFHHTVDKLRHSLAEASFDLASLHRVDTAAEEREHIQPSGNDTSQRSGPTRIYRGRRIEVALPEELPAAPSKPLSLGEPVTDREKRPRRVYRGRVIED